ncbi:tRNA pseudouridine synthase B [Buchnera aphidicola str. Bp (Baizongia pistaciae)]|uniref:tRNA pseudouridine synthase B n=1 Tax=Buchnera aphidicola subsp. Baizongia pistaciae (strain Bp) TaxID=224915 RepID=TRUB_BUCBP|nr:tRNA pseudouridine(55) synthase TruB [Buchnera aphidicola]Q89AF6.1 RecName: Full=tRNA pseudouridine synthase B; AltName: Full=tRNA pseudouridine(55) synthase; Short=Psi55 synthase; AltName: Full=tRNA pseudouridylate synthase; AltName: Full=tRNA-uridine isomerase [Buchnera aphidicola str. Bp (Baizongia pistaciae)]AAO27059.1 tRNA pseudouridine synthase B [Buchnera aphidicola str. Bp (Baizongia pistaciae)]
MYSEFRSIDGIILIDKPYGLSSHETLQKVKGILKIKKMGHTGTLDPLATGMLPMCCGRATKFSQFLMNFKKRYRVIAKLGQKTSTSDSEGQIIHVRPITFTNLQLQKVLKSFHGKIKQIPSMYSAIKYHGHALYKYARQGIVISRKVRDAIIYELKVLGYSYKHKYLELDIICSKGTYIRTLIEDVGEKLNCGAHVISLRRLQVGNYTSFQMIDIKTLNKLVKYNINVLEHILLSVDNAISCFPEVNIVPNVIKNLQNGQKVKTHSGFINQFVRITEGINRRFIGIGKINNINELYSYRLII